MSSGNGSSPSPYAPHTRDETDEMLDAIGTDSVDELFDIPPSVEFDGEFGIPERDEKDTRQHVADVLGENDDLTEFLGRGHYSHYIPSMVDHIADRSEFLTSYTQYQPEVAQGFLQTLFEYQSMVVELTGLGIANASMYDHATALGEAALLAARVEDGDVVLVPDILPEERRDVLENYVRGAGLEIEEYETRDGNVDTDALETKVAEREDGDEDGGNGTVMVYAENPTARGTVEGNLTAIGEIS
ncbi:MAG: glycine dehydrogenase, partial [Halobacteria archaeon]|nr:glycine dehydrogenase [Halobacteria archaeon]